MDSAGGPAGFARDILCNESKLPGTNRLRPEGIYEGLSRLAALDTSVTNAEHLRAAAADESTSAKAAWLSVKGFGVLAWSYLIMNAGVSTETKPDVMVQRYLARVSAMTTRLIPHARGISSSSRPRNSELNPGTWTEQPGSTRVRQSSRFA
jgi:hypothetical protein